LNIVASFEDIVGSSPDCGTRLFRLRPGGDPNRLDPANYMIYHFTNSVWWPSVPMADIGEGVFIFQPPKPINLRVVADKFTFDLEPVTYNIVISVSAQFTVEYSSIPAGGTWQTLTNFVSDGHMRTIVDDTAISATAQRFYRITVADNTHN